jgi:uncharacterized protein with von Willebrand factor type A (vWA) domain
MTEDAAELTAALVGFARLLREHGIRLSPAEVSRLQAAVGVLPSDNIGHLYWAGRVCLGVSAGSAGIYDAVFAQYFLGIPDPKTEPTGGAGESASSVGDRANSPRARTPLDVAAEPDGPGNQSAGEQVGKAASDVEVLRITPFAACTQQELATVATLARRLRTKPPQRPGRRMVPGTRREALDLRATAQLAMKTQAHILKPAWRQHQKRPRQVVILLDVSRSMALYSRLFLHFSYALAASRSNVEVVCFGTQLTRITGLLRSRRPALALERAAMSVLDWNGGTRIADAVGGLRSMRGLRAALRGAIVVICSDGLEHGDPADLGTQMSLLHRTCNQIIWVNPLAGDERYQPIAGGMRAALPWVDQLMPGDTLAALQDVAAVLSGSKPPQHRRFRVSRLPQTHWHGQGPAGRTGGGDWAMRAAAAWMDLTMK